MYARVSMYVSVYVGMYVCMYTCMYAIMHACMHMHITITNMHVIYICMITNIHVIYICNRIFDHKYTCQIYDYIYIYI